MDMSDDLADVLPSRGKRKATDDRPTQLLDLPEDVLGHVATFLPLSDQLALLSTHPQILSLARTHLNPLPGAIHDLIDKGPPYPHLLSQLPSLSLFLPDDAGHMFIELLVRARPRWILERLELGRWSERVWKEAFEKRFLPSWKRFKGEDDAWRAIFLRTLSRLEHRNLGCTHEESWTRFVTLHRNGSGSINRMYSRLFDPYDIFDELKNQNDFASQSTQVRVLVHLQDVRILAIGVLISTPSLFVNPNAHLLLHPPLLRQFSNPDQTFGSETQRAEGVLARYSARVVQNEPHDDDVRDASTGQSSGASTGSSGTPARAGISIKQPIEPAPSLATPSSPLKEAFASLLPGRMRRSVSSSNPRDTSPSRLGSVLTLVRSRDRDAGAAVRSRNQENANDGRSRAWSLSRTRSRTDRTDGIGELPFIVPPTIASGAMPPVPERSTDPSPSPAPSIEPKPSYRGLPYAPLTHPLPNTSHRLYPNHTTPHFLSQNPGLFMDNQAPPASDTRHRHEEVEDDFVGILFSAGEAYWGGDGTRMAEVNPRTGQRCRWVGPMILVAQLHPCDRNAAHPSGSVSYDDLEGVNVDLGPKGMYASLGFEDLEVLAPWVELRGGGGNSTDAKRDFLN